MRRPDDPRRMNPSDSSTTPNAFSSERPRLIDIAEVAALLGVEVRHVRRLVFERRIPYIKWGHLLRFDVDDLVEWIDQARVPAHSDSATARTASRPTSARLRVASSE